ncbi:MAG: TIM barrel protein [Marinovum sp.]|nr:TIM barrel protein [Marinovum sp.]
MTQFSANLGFLWNNIPLSEAIYAAAAAGFDAVECHWPYDQTIKDVQAALRNTSLTMLGLNTRRGQPGENGLAALPGREGEARAAIDEAIAYANAIDAQAIHVMSGFAKGPDAKATFLENLRYATEQTERTILIEPLNRHDAPGYFLETTDQACDIIHTLGHPSVKLMFDCYHVGRSEGDLTTRLEALLDHIGHIQFASVPDRGTPDHGELNYPMIFEHIAALGWNKPLGAEYKPTGPTADSLSWLQSLR